VPFIQVGPWPLVFHTYFYNIARRLRLEKLLYTFIRLSRSSGGHFKPLLDQGGGFASEAAARRFRSETAVIIRGRFEVETVTNL
jgi:hypothetical protein